MDDGRVAFPRKAERRDDARATEVIVWAPSAHDDECVRQVIKFSHAAKHRDAVNDRPMTCRFVVEVAKQPPRPPLALSARTASTVSRPKPPAPMTTSSRLLSLS